MQVVVPFSKVGGPFLLPMFLRLTLDPKKRSTYGPFATSASFCSALFFDDEDVTKSQNGCCYPQRGRVVYLNKLDNSSCIFFFLVFFLSEGFFGVVVSKKTLSKVRWL